MFGKRSTQVVVSILLGFFSVGVFFGIVHQSQASVLLRAVSYTATEDRTAIAEQSITETQSAIPSHTVYLPFAMKYYPLKNIFGVESTVSFTRGNNVFTNTVNLSLGWMRLNGRVSWRTLQPDDGAAIQWEKLASFENELRTLKEAGITPIVIVDDYPQWATDNPVRSDGQPTSCGRLREDKVDDFANFVTQIVNRYKTYEFNVRTWELGNEPDVDPDLVPPNNEFGCWGDIADPYYGGEAYGRMIIQVGGAIKAADPLAQVWIGGLLLATPNTTDPNLGHPELFLEGILRSGAAPYFDLVPYHWYPSYGYQQTVNDYDLHSNPWIGWGGGSVGKARYLRQLMQAYGVSKPLFLDETSFICPYDSRYPDRYPWCEIPTDDFYDLQANYIVRSTTRVYNENVLGIIWYTVNGPGWRWGGLLDAAQSPRPVYRAYQQMTNRYRNSRIVGSVYYADGIEAYTFDQGAVRLDVLWSINNQTITVTVPITDWIGASGRDGEVITPTLSGTNYLLPVGFSPIYLELLP
jgi:hypothetical protein